MKYHTPADAYKLLLGMDMLYETWGIADQELLACAYAVTSDFTALWQEASMK
jgi:hypothetical protein